MLDIIIVNKINLVQITRIAGLAWPGCHRQTRQFECYDVCNGAFLYSSKPRFYSDIFYYISCLLACFLIDCSYWWKLILVSVAFSCSSFQIFWSFPTTEPLLQLYFSHYLVWWDHTCFLCRKRKCLVNVSHGCTECWVDTTFLFRI